MPAQGGGVTSMMPPMRDDDGGYGYDEERPGGGRRRQPKKSNTSTILLVIAAVLVLVGAIFIGKSFFSGNGGSQEPTPNLVGQTLSDAKNSLTNVNLTLAQGTPEFCTQPKNHVCRQDPKAGTPISKNATVTVILSKGSKPIPLPNELTKNVDAAKQELIDKGFTNVVPKPDDGTSGKPVNTVIHESPDAGTPVTSGTKIVLTYSAAPTQVTVPDVSSTPQAFTDAKAQLVALGFKVAEALGNSPTVPAGDVISQDPAANTQAAKGSTVTLTVSQGAGTATTVPTDIVGHRYNEVVNELQGQGIQTTVAPGNPTDNKAIVTGSNPQPGQPITPGQPVVLNTQDGGGLFGGQG
jgi:eukaryotic-like serine/threonine-protein kinase